MKESSKFDQNLNFVNIYQKFLQKWIPRPLLAQLKVGKSQKVSGMGCPKIILVKGKKPLAVI